MYFNFFRQLYFSLIFPVLSPLLLDFGTNKPKSIYFKNKNKHDDHDYTSESSDDENYENNKTSTDRYKFIIYI